MTPEKLPAFQFYPADWRKDPGVQALSKFDQGMWVNMLCLMSESPRRGVLLLPSGLPMPIEALARSLGENTETTTATVQTLLDYGVAYREEETGAIYNKRMVKDEALRQTRTESGKKGGNPNLVNQNPTTGVNQNSTTPDNQNPTPSSSPSGKGNPGEIKNISPVVPIRDEAFDFFCDAYKAQYGLPYTPDRNQKTGDFVQAAKLRARVGVEARARPPDYAVAVANYFVSPQDSHTFADLCVRYDTFRLHALDRYKQPIQKPPAQRRMADKPTVVC